MLEEALVPPRAGEAQRRILIVDHDLSQVEQLAARLESQGYETHATVSSRAALEEIAAWRPHLLLADLHLPAEDGLSLSRQVTESPHEFALPLILASPMTRPDIVRCSRGCGCRYYVRKPYDPNALLALIEQAISETAGC